MRGGKKSSESNFAVPQGFNTRRSAIWVLLSPPPLEWEEGLGLLFQLLLLLIIIGHSCFLHLQDISGVVSHPCCFSVWLLDQHRGYLPHCMCALAKISHQPKELQKDVLALTLSLTSSNSQENVHSTNPAKGNVC